MSRTTRRVFLMSVAAAGPLLAGTFAAQAAQAAGGAPKLDEKDPLAASLGYVADTAKADAKKYPKHTKDQKCANCVLYQGKAGDAAAICPIFSGKQVAAAGWCASWAKKA